MIFPTDYIVFFRGVQTTNQMFNKQLATGFIDEWAFDDKLIEGLMVI